MAEDFKKRERPKGIFGVAKKHSWFSVEGDDWSSDDSDDDFHPIRGGGAVSGSDSEDGGDQKRNPSANERWRRRRSSGNNPDEVSSDSNVVSRRKRQPAKRQSSDSESPSRASRKRNVPRKSYAEDSDDSSNGRNTGRPQSGKRGGSRRASESEDFEATLGVESDDLETATVKKKKTRKKKVSAVRAKKVDLTSDDDDDFDGDDSDEYRPTKKIKRAKRVKSRSNAPNARVPKKLRPDVKTKRRKRSTPKDAASPLVFEVTRSNEKSEGDDNSALPRDKLMQGWKWAHRLPLHVLVNIFQMVVDAEGAIPFLLHAEQISPVWDSAAQTDSLWRKVDLTGGWANLDIKKFTKLCRNQFGSLEELVLPSSLFVNDAVAALAAHCSSTLESLSLPGCRKLKETVAVKHIPTSFPRLRAVDLSDLNQPRGLKTIVQGFGERLVSLNISRNVIPSFPGLFQAVVAHSPSLEVLDISNIHGGSVLSLKISNFQKSCPKMRTLRMAGWILNSTDTREEIACMRGFSRLEDLSLAQANSSSVLAAHRLNASDNNVLRLLLAASDDLRVLDIRGVRGLTASGLDVSLLGPPINSFITKAPQLRHLFWSGVSKTDISKACPLGSDMDFRQLLTSLRDTLSTLDLSQNVYPPSHLNAFCSAFERGYLEGDAGPPLADLNLSSTNVEEDHVRRLLTACPALVTLNLAGCRALPREMKKLFDGQNLAALKKDLSR